MTLHLHYWIHIISLPGCSKTGSFLVLRTGAITKWHGHTKDLRDTEQYPHHKTKENQQWFPWHQETAQKLHWNAIFLAAKIEIFLSEASSKLTQKK